MDASMAERPVLYSFATSSAAWRVRVALAMKGVDYEYRAVNLSGAGGGEHMTDEYKAVNPAQQVPSLIIDGETIVQSIPIIEYLEETRPGPNILPKDPMKRAKARMIAEMVNSYIHILQGRRIGNALQDYGVDASRIGEWKAYWIARGMQTIEEMLTNTAGKFCVGDDITLADIVLIPQIANAYKFSVDMEKFPMCLRIYKTCLQEEVFKVSAPENQPDAPQKK